MAFADLWSAMANAENYVKHVVKYALSNCEMDLDFFNSFVDTGLRQRLIKLVEEPFVRIAYKDAIAVLQEEISKDRLGLMLLLLNYIIYCLYQEFMAISRR